MAFIAAAYPNQSWTATPTTGYDGSVVTLLIRVFVLTTASVVLVVWGILLRIRFKRDEQRPLGFAAIALMIVGLATAVTAMSLLKACFATGKACFR